MNLINCQKLESLGYIFAADSVGLIFIQIFVVGSEGRTFCAIVCAMAIQVHPTSLTNRKRVCNFLLVINSNLGPIPRFRDTEGFLLRTATPPLFYPNFGVFPLD